VAIRTMNSGIPQHHRCFRVPKLGGLTWPKCFSKIFYYVAKMFCFFCLGVNMNKLFFKNFLIRGKKGIFFRWGGG
jgi:hypothetical protein